MPDRGEDLWCAARRGQACALMSDGSFCMVGGYASFDTTKVIMRNINDISSGVCMRLRLTSASAVIPAMRSQGRQPLILSICYPFIVHTALTCVTE